MQSVVIAIVVVLAVIVVAAVAIWLWSRRRHTARLQERFGPEYGQTVRRTGDRSRAENELQTRQDRVEKLQIRPLSDDERARFTEAWKSAQAQFVDDPRGAILQADHLVSEVMQTRGYPMGDFEQRAADISVDHAQMVNHYRAAHAAAGQAETGEAGTDDLRQGLLHYRALFDELLESPTVARAEPAQRTEARR
ncbi:MAG TPA: hypothetical protein VFO27_06195 [Bryobacteraceae bacterium]|nr:hypothetical protein [Bryobacteraceae bacterium]